MVVGYGIYYIYKLPKFKQGHVAPDFTASLINGETFTLSALRGDYVLLDFWGSWCGPCRMENPELVKLYNEYQLNVSSSSPNFNIVSIAVETNEASWRNAIVNDGLIWDNHIYEKGRFKSPIVTSYGVKEIPTKYLIDPEGNILATNPSFEEIRNILTANLK